MTKPKGIIDTYTPEGLQDVPGYEGLYAVTADGQVWSYPKTHWRKGRGVWLKQYDKRGYLVVKLCKYDTALNKYVDHYIGVHRLVAMAFIPTDKDFSKLQANHLDGNKQNNSVGNLEWNTAKENTHHAIRTGLRRSTGAANGNAKLTAEQVLEIRQRHIKKAKGFGMGNTHLLAQEYGIDRATIWAITTYKTHKELQPTL